MSEPTPSLVPMEGEEMASRDPSHTLNAAREADASTLVSGSVSPFVMPIMERDEHDNPRGDVRFTWAPTPEHRAQSLRNHSQTLERLRERGGVAWTELYCIVAGKELFSIRHDQANEVRARAWLHQRFPQGVTNQAAPAADAAQVEREGSRDALSNPSVTTVSGEGEKSSSRADVAEPASFGSTVVPEAEQAGGEG